MGLADNDEIGKVAPDDIVSFVSRRMRGLNPDAVFLSCTNIKNVIGGWVSLPILLVITAAIHSTTDGLLHIVGALLPSVTFGNGTPTPGPPGRRHATGKADL